MITLRLVTFEGDDERAIRHIRESVFVEEQGISAEIDFDGLDASAFQVLVYMDGEAVGTGRMLGDGHIGRIAVLKPYRGQQVGTEIVLSFIKVARDKGYERVYLGAQAQAKGFYENLGFKQFGESFIDAGDIPHVSMEMVFGQT